MFSSNFPSVFKKNSRTEKREEKTKHTANHSRSDNEAKSEPTKEKPAEDPEKKQGPSNEVLNTEKADSQKHTHTSHSFDDALLITHSGSYHPVPVQHVVIKTGRSRQKRDLHGPDLHNDNVSVRSRISALDGPSLSNKKKVGDLLHSQLYPQNNPYDDGENSTDDDDDDDDDASFDLDISVLGSTGSSTLDRAARHLVDNKRDDEKSHRDGNADEEEEELWPESFLRSEIRCEPELLNDAALRNNSGVAPEEKVGASSCSDPNLNESQINGQVFSHIGSKMFRAQRDRACSFSSSKVHHGQQKVPESKKDTNKATKDGTSGSSLPIMLSIVLVSMVLYRVEILFSQHAQQNSDDTFQKIMADAISCSNEQCNGNGACAHHLDVWKSFSAMGLPGFGKVINFPANVGDNNGQKDACFCFDDFKGEMCDQGRSVKISDPYLHDEWIMNDFYGGMEFSTDDPICGVQSLLYNTVQFRQMFKFSTCEIDMKLRTSYEHKTYESWWGEVPFDFICDDGVLTGLSSLRDVRDSHEDFLWVATCTHFDNTKIDLETCDGGISGPENNSSAILGFEDMNVSHLDVTCGDGKVVTGIKPTPGNKGNGGFKVRCCELVIDKNSSSTNAFHRSLNI